MIWYYQRDRERHANYLFAVWRPWLPLYIYMDKYVFQFGKKYIMEKIYIYSSGFWWETKQTPITSSRCPIPSQVQSKDTKLPRADNMVSEENNSVKWCNFSSLHWHAIFTISTGIRISQPKIIPHNNDIIDQRNGAVLTILQRHLMEGKKMKTFCHNFLHFDKS